MADGNPAGGEADGSDLARHKLVDDGPGAASPRRNVTVDGSDGGSGKFGSPGFTSPTLGSGLAGSGDLVSPLQAVFTEAEEEESGWRLPSRKSARAWLRSPHGNLWDLVQTLLTMYACTDYVMRTYHLDMGAVAEWIVTVFFTLDYLLRLYGAPNRLLHAREFYPMIDLLTVTPVYVGIWVDESAFNGLVFLRFVRILRVMRVLKGFTGSSVAHVRLTPLTRGVINLVLTVAAIMFLAAGLIHLAESDPDCDHREDDECFTFGLSLYFMVVTISTVGYGDVSPDTDWGRLVVSAMIIASLVILPAQIENLRQVASLRSKFGGAVEADPASPHVLVVGCTAQRHVLEAFLVEFYHPERLEALGELGQHRRVVIMGPDEPSQAVQNLLLDMNFEQRVQYVRGSVTSASDLRRVAAGQADATFVLADPTSTDSRYGDKLNLLRTLMIKNFQPRMQTLVHIMDPTFEKILAQTSDESTVDTVLCTDRLKSQLLALSVGCPGFSTLVLNLLHTSADIDTTTLDESSAWLAEYGEGAGREVYTSRTPTFFDGQTFADVAITLYKATSGKVIVWGCKDVASGPQAAAEPRMVPTPSMPNLHSKRRQSVGAQVRHDRGEILLNPGPGYRVRAGQLLLLTCSEQALALNIEDDGFYSGLAAPTVPEGARYGFSRSAKRSSSLGSSKHSVGRVGAVKKLMVMSSLVGLRAHGANAQAVQKRLDRQKEEEEEAKYRVLMSKVLTRVEFSNHVVVLGSSGGLEDLVDICISSGQKVVVVNPMDDTDIAVLEELAVSSDNFFVVKGAENSRTTLAAAGLSRARCCVILSDREQSDDLDGDDLDSDLLFAYLAIDSFRQKHRVHPDFFVLACATSTTNLVVLDAKAAVNYREAARRASGVTPISTFKHRRSGGVAGAAAEQRAIVKNAWTSGLDEDMEHVSFEDPMQNLPFYAAGYGFAANNLHTLLVQAFYDSHVYRLAQAMLAPIYDSKNAAGLTRIALPVELKGKTFGEAFNILLGSRGAILVGVYRAPQTNGSRLPYVYTAPNENANLNEKDYLFVLFGYNADGTAAHSSTDMHGTDKEMKEEEDVHAIDIDGIDTELSPHPVTGATAAGEESHDRT